MNTWIRGATFGFLALVLVMGGVSETSKRREAQATPLVLLVPEAAVGSLEILYAGVATAAFVGIISASQEEAFGRQIDGMIASIESASSEAFARMGREIVQLYNEIAGAIGWGLAAPAPAAPVPAAPAPAAPVLGEQIGVCPVIEALPAKKVDVKDLSLPQTASQSAAISRINSCKDPKDCCKEFKDHLKERRDVKVDKLKDGGLYLHYRDLSGRWVECCFELDKLHKDAYEIFLPNGCHGGEHGCDDWFTNPCTLTLGRGTHSLPNSYKHKARIGCPEKKTSVRCQD